MNSTTDQVDASLLNRRLYSGSDITENVTIRSDLLELLPETHELRDSLQGMRVQPRNREMFFPPTCGATTQVVATYSWTPLDPQHIIIFCSGPNASMSNFAQEPAVDPRWMRIVRQELGVPNDAPTIDVVGTDPTLYGMATIACIEFCTKHGILDALGKCLAKAKELFSDVVSVSADYDSLPPDESDEVGHTVIKVEVRSDQDTAFRDYERYADWMLETIPLNKSAFFTVVFSRV